MPQGLPRKIKIAFILQAVLASCVLAVGLFAAGMLGKHTLIERRMQVEAEHFLRGRASDPDYPLPRTSAMRAYLATERDAAAVPQALRGLGPGLHTLAPDGHFGYVADGTGGRLYLTYFSELTDRVVLWTVLVAIALALAAISLVSWLTYRTSKRLVTPVSWLAGEVARWDPRDPDISMLAPERLPDDVGSEVQQLGAALRGLAIRVREFVERERDFTRDASHELRTPLTVIRVASDLVLADAELPPRTQRTVQRIQRAGHDMEAVIDAFLILAREADIAPLSEEFEVGDVVREEVEKARGLLVGKPVRLELIETAAPRLYAPRRVLGVMLGNLLSNACAHTDSGRIVVRLSKTDITVADSGVGMTRDALDKAFSPFFRADPNEPVGKGIGLSIVRRLSDRFDWPVSLESEPGQGTVATIRFAH